MFKKFKDFFNSDIGLTVLAILVFCVVFGIIAVGMSSDSSMSNSSNYKNTESSFGYRMNLRGKMGWGIGKNGINYYNFGK